MMKALVREGGKLRLKNIPRPAFSRNEALLKVLKAGIYSTDLELLKG